MACFCASATCSMPIPSPYDTGGKFAGGLGTPTIWGAEGGADGGVHDAGGGGASLGYGLGDVAFAVVAGLRYDGGGGDGVGAEVVFGADAEGTSGVVPCEGASTVGTPGGGPPEPVEPPAVSKTFPVPADAGSGSSSVFGGGGGARPSLAAALSSPARHAAYLCFDARSSESSLH